MIFVEVTLGKFEEETTVRWEFHEISEGEVFCFKVFFSGGKSEVSFQSPDFPQNARNKRSPFFEGWVALLDDDGIDLRFSDVVSPILQEKPDFELRIQIFLEYRDRHHTMGPTRQGFVIQVLTFSSGCKFHGRLIWKNAVAKKGVAFLVSRCNFGVFA